MQGDQGCLQTCLVDIYCHILHTGVEAGDEAHAGAWDLPDQGLAPSWDG
jgi:hypothetical protein